MSGSKFSRSGRTVRSRFQNLGSTTERPKEMDIVNDPRGSLQNMILVTKKIGDRESEVVKKQKKKKKKNVANQPKH